MKHLILIVALALTVVHCRDTSHPIEKHTSLIIGDPMEVGIENRLLFSAGTSYPKAVRSLRGAVRDKIYGFSSGSSRYDSYAEKEYRNNNLGNIDIQNLLFYNPKNKESYKLTEDTIHILSFAIHHEFENPLIFYRVVKEDYNGDQKFDDDDPVIFCVSDLLGTNFTEITPVNEQLVDYIYYPETKSILIKTLIDIDKNKKFNIADETNFVEMSLLSPSKGISIFDEQLKASLKGQLGIEN